MGSYPRADIWIQYKSCEKNHWGSDQRRQELNTIVFQQAKLGKVVAKELQFQIWCLSKGNGIKLANDL